MNPPSIPIERCLYTSTPLPPPSVIFSNRHLLVVNKPAGWRSIPLDSAPKDYITSRRDDEKCLMADLKRRGLGGGSQNDYLKPVHRLDQPCTGLIVYAKNSKAASRIQIAWARRNVHKEYYLVVESNTNLSSGVDVGWKRLLGKCLKRETFRGMIELYRHPMVRDMVQNMTGNDTWTTRDDIYVLMGMLRKRQSGLGSVRVSPFPPRDLEQYLSSRENADYDATKREGTFCYVEIRRICSISDLRERRDNSSVNTRPLELLAVRTTTGLRHQIRALVAQVGGCPVVGDLRYGNSHTVRPLSDQSVALHARAIYMPTVKLGETDLSTKPFVAPIPTTWETYFGLTEDDLPRNYGR